MRVLDLSEKHFILDVEKSLRKVAEFLYTFLTTPDKVKKYTALIEKTLEAKIMMQSSSSNDYVRCYKIEILNLFNHSQLKTN